ncbi:MAG: phosphoadenosine phosphosulfate reductase family protein [Desulfurococcaceae archaeon]
MYGLKWFRKQNTPVLVKDREKAWLLRSDAWLAGDIEKEILSNIIQKQFELKIDFRKKHVVFHRVPSWSSGVEYAVEIFGEAARLGLMYYSSLGEWRLVPSAALASILAELGAGVIEIKGDQRRRLKNKRIELGKETCVNDNYMLIGVGEYVGVAKIIDPGRCIVKVEDLAPRGFRLLNDPSPGDLIEINKQVVEEAANEAKEFIRTMYEKYVKPGKIYVSFSGGADSTAVLALAAEALGENRVIAVYSDTGLEYPDNKKYVEEIASKLGVELVVLKPEKSFINEIGKRGLMSVNNRWCTNLLKLEPLRKFYNSTNVKIYLDGARDFESSLRAKTPRLAENPALPGVLRALPIKKWPRILVQLYLYSRGLKLNPLYSKGLTRIGCIVCPAMHRYELELSYQMYSEIHEEIIKAAGINIKDYLSMKWSGRRSLKALGEGNAVQLP